MNQDNWLSQLAPPHAPPSPGWWPLAPGWWIIIITIFLIIIIRMVLWRLPSRQQQRLALAELEAIEKNSADDEILAQRIEQLLRRYALTRFKREEIAHLTGQKWLEFIIKHGGKEFSGESGQYFLAVSYGGKAPTDRQRWLQGAQAFLRGS